MRLARACSAAALGTSVVASLGACSLLTDIDGFSEVATGADAGSGGDADAIDGGEGDALPGDARAEETSTGDAARSYAEVVLATPGLVGYWRFGEQSGTTVAPSRSSLSGVAAGGASLGSSSLVGESSDRAVAFAGAGSLNFGSSFPFDGKKSFSVEVWHSPTGLAGYQTLVKQHLNDQGGWIMSVAANGYQFYRESKAGSVPILSGVVPALGSVHHLVGTYDGIHRHRLYVDGVLRGGPEDDAVLAIPTNDFPTLAGPELEGVLDEFAIYDRPLPDATIAEHYAVGARK